MNFIKSSLSVSILLFSTLPVFAKPYLPFLSKHLTQAPHKRALNTVPQNQNNTSYTDFSGTWHLAEADSDGICKSIFDDEEETGHLVIKNDAQSISFSSELSQDNEPTLPIGPLFADAATDKYGYSYAYIQYAHWNNDRTALFINGIDAFRSPQNNVDDEDSTVSSAKLSMNDSQIVITLKEMRLLVDKMDIGRTEPISCHLARD